MAVASDAAFVAFRFSERYQRLTRTFPGLDGPAYRSLIRSLQARARAVAGQLGTVRQRRLGGALTTIADPNEVFEAVLPPGGGTFQWSSRRFGMCRDLEARILEAFEEFVARYESNAGRERIDDDALWQQVASDRRAESVVRHLETGITVASGRYEYKFRAGWQNGRTQVVEPISLDYAEPRDMVEKALTWRGRLEELGAGTKFLMTAIVTEPVGASGRYEEKYAHALAVLRECEGVRAVFPVSRTGEFAQLVEADLSPH
jgi:hypothetical protein